MKIFSVLILSRLYRYLFLIIFPTILITGVAVYLSLQPADRNPVNASSYKAIKLDTNPMQFVPYYMAYDRSSNSLWLPALIQNGQSFLYQYDIETESLRIFNLNENGAVNLNSGVDLDENNNLWIGYNHTILVNGSAPAIESNLIKYDTKSHNYQKYSLNALENEFKGREKAPLESVGYIQDMIVGPDNNIYITRWLANSITIFHPDNATFEEIKTPRGFGVPGKIFKNENELYFQTEYADNPLGNANQPYLKYDVATNKFKVGNHFMDSMAVGNDGLLYLNSWASGETIVQYDPTTNQETKVFNLGPFAGKLLKSRDGNIWFSQAEMGEINKLNPASGEIVSEATFPLQVVEHPFIPDGVEPPTEPLVNGPDITDMEEDKNGNLYFIIANYDEIYKINSSQESVK